MKKKFLIILLCLLIALSLITLVSCNSKDPTVLRESISRLPISSFNDDDFRNSAVNFDVFTSSPMKKTFNKSEIYSKEYIKDGLLIVKDENDNIGFYSLIFQSYIVPRTLYKDWVKYKVFNVEDIGFILTIKYENNLYILDSFGNSLYQNEDNGYYSSITSGAFSSKVIDGNIYLIMNLFGNKYFEYGYNYSFSEVDNLPTPSETHNNNSENTYYYTVKDRFVSENCINLGEYGLNGYKMVLINDNCVVYDDNNQQCAFFNLPYNSYIIGDTMLCQDDYVLPDDSTEYSYYDTKKHDLISYSINLKNGHKTELKLNYKINYCIPIGKVVGANFSCGFANFKQINGKHLGAFSAGIIDNNGVILDKMPQVELNNLRKLSNNNYFDLNNNILYDSSFKMLSSLNGLSPKVDNVNKLIWIVNKDGKKGAINFDGIVAISPKYKRIDESSIDGKFVAYDDYNTYIVDTHNFTETNSSYEYIGQNLYFDKDSLNNGVFYNTAGDIIYSTNQQLSYVDGGSKYLWLNKNRYAYVCLENLSNSYDIYNFNYNYNSNTYYSSVSIGSALEKHGSNKNDAIPLSIVKGLHFKNNFSEMITLDRNKTNIIEVYDPNVEIAELKNDNNYNLDSYTRFVQDSKTYFIINNDLSNLYVKFKKNNASFDYVPTKGKTKLFIENTTSFNIDSNDVETIKLTNDNFYLVSKTLVFNSVNSNLYVALDGVVNKLEKTYNISIEGNSTKYISIINRSNNIVNIGFSLADTNTTISGFNVLNDSNSPYNVTNESLCSTNKSNNSTSTIKLTATRSGTFTFDFNISSESTYDKGQFYINGSKKIEESGSKNIHKSFYVYKNDILEFKYTKDGSNSSGLDRLLIENMSFT